MKKAMNGMKKKIVKHLKKDTKEFKEQIKEDVKLKKNLMSKKGKC